MVFPKELDNRYRFPWFHNEFIEYIESFFGSELKPRR